MFSESVRKKGLAGALVLAVLLTALVPILSFADRSDADGGGADLTIYRLTPKLSVTSDDPGNIEYIVWDFGDGTVLDGRWEYYIHQQNAGEELSDEIIAGIEEYRDLLAENGNSLWVTTHTYASAGTYDVTMVAINAIGYVSPENGMPYDGVFSTDETGFDGGLFDASASDVTSPSDSDLESSEFKAVAGSWCRVPYSVELLGFPTISFESNGGSAVAQITVENGSEFTSAAAPSEPTRDGYEFTGWFSDEGCTVAYDWSSLVTEPITLYAGWTDSSAPVVTMYDHIITYKDGSSTIGTKNVRNEVDGFVYTAIDIADPSKDGYRFAGWSLEENGTAQYLRGATVIVDTDGLDLYAVWEQVTVPAPASEKVIVKVDGQDVQMESGKTVGDLTEPTKEGLVFDGWYSDEACTQKLADSEVLTAGMNVYAHFSAAEDEDSLDFIEEYGEWIPWIVLAAGAVIALVGYRFRPILIVVGLAVCVVAGLDLGGILNLF